jgi:RNA polymerase primary sigma factor
MTRVSAKRSRPAKKRPAAAPPRSKKKQPDKKGNKDNKDNKNATVTSSSSSQPALEAAAGSRNSAMPATEVKSRRRRRATPAGIAPSEPERDILDQYLYEVSTYPLLKGNEEIEVARKIRAGDPDALQELVKRNLRFVISVAKKYQNRGLPLIDLIGEGNVGLLTAARKFDPDQGVKFISYAVWWIRQAILSSLARQGRTVRVPLNRTADLSRIIKASEILRQKMRREPTP